VDHVPEVGHGSRTASGHPVVFQFLGGDPEKLALSALKAVEAGAGAIDLNFGCPAPIVNKHDGGAALLRYPDRIEKIVGAVRGAVPSAVPVSAKLRLGWDSMEAIHENAERAVRGGASWITIHGRTKVQGYIPPAYWGPIGDVVRRYRGEVPVIANGEIFTIEDFRRCREETSAEHFMLGRGVLANPALGIQVARELGIAVSPETLAWAEAFQSAPADWRPLLERFVEVGLPMSPDKRDQGYVLARIKQWVRYAWVRSRAPFFERLKRATSIAEVFAILEDETGARGAKMGHMQSAVELVPLQ
jgi:tRNA-dihydrouridine synthase C